MSVFTAVRNSDGETRVFPARGYQEQAYLAFMLNDKILLEGFVGWKNRLTMC